VKVKNKKFLLAFFVVCFVLTCFIGSAGAASYSHSYAVIDWATIQITEPLHGTTYWGSKHSGSLAWAADDFDTVQDTESDGDWGDTTADVSLPNAWGQAWTDDDELYEEVEAATDGSYTLYAAADAWAERSASYWANQSGVMRIFADYTLYQDLSTENLGDKAKGVSKAFLRLVSQDDPGITDYAEVILGHSVQNGGTFSDTLTGTLMVELECAGGNHYNFYASVWNSSEVEVPIPEPATICLIGLGGLLLRRRK